MKPYQIKRIETASLVVILVLALVLRLAGLRWGLPTQSHLFSYHPDEVPVLGAVWYMLTTGDWDPHFYNYGTFYIYLVAVCAKAGMVTGFLSVSDAGWAGLHLLARALTALMGAATVYLVYLLGKRVGGLPVGLGAAALLAVLPAHVVNSHYATVDVPATFMVTLLFVILAHLFADAEIGWYLLAGLALGLAAATKYTMAVALLAFLFAHLFARDEQSYPPSVLFLIAGLIVAGLAFVAVTPYLFVMGHEGFQFNPDFLRDFKFEMEHMRVGGTSAFVNTGPGWLYHLLRSLPAGMGYPALVLGIVGAGLMIWRGGAVAWLLFSFTLPCFIIIGAGKERFLRYTLPLLPVLAVAAAYALDMMRQASMPRLGKWKSIPVPALLGAGLFAVTIWYSGQMVGIMMAPDVRTRAANWLRLQAPHSTRIGLASIPWYYTPPITPYNGGVRSLSEFHEWQRDNPPYHVIVVGWDLAALRRDRPNYFIISDAEYADPLRLQRLDAVALMAALPKRFPGLEAFEPPPPLPWLRPKKTDCPPDWLYTWPRIEVYY